LLNTSSNIRLFLPRDVNIIKYLILNPKARSRETATLCARYSQTLLASINVS